MVLGKRDQEVIYSFINRRRAEGNKLSTDGLRLDGHWMGGSGIASWEDGSIAFHDLGSRAAQTVQRAVRRAAKLKHQNPTFWIKKSFEHHKPGYLHRALGVPIGQTIPMHKLEAAARGGATELARSALRALTLRRLKERKK